MKKLLLFIALIAAGVIGNNMFHGRTAFQMRTLKLVNTYSPSSPLYADEQAFVDKFNANDKLRGHYAGIITSKGLYAAWKAAFSRGARSLPQDRLVEAAKTQVAILARLPEASCAKFARPQDDFDQALGADIRTAVESLPPHRHQVMNDFFYDSLQAELDDAPVIPVDEDNLKVAMMVLSQRYPGEYGERLVGVLRNPTAASDADACWAANSLMTTAADLPDQEAEALLRKSFGG
jgi:hypothetical protein